MSAEGKITTTRLRSGTRIMVARGEEVDGTVQCRESRTKRKGATIFNVVRVEPAQATTMRARRTYHIFGVLESGEVARIPHAAGNQTFWKA
jgi:hypothetical protein